MCIANLSHVEFSPSPDEKVGIPESPALDARPQDLTWVRARWALLALVAGVTVFTPTLVAVACPVAGADLLVVFCATAPGRVLVAAAVGAAPRAVAVAGAAPTLAISGAQAIRVARAIRVVAHLITKSIQLFFLNKIGKGKRKFHQGFSALFMPYVYPKI